MKSYFKRKNQDRPRQQIKNPRVDSTKSIYLRRTKNSLSAVQFFTKNMPSILKTAIFRQEGKNAQRKRSMDKSAQAGDIPTGGANYNPFLLNPEVQPRDVCVQRLVRRQVLFAQNVAGKNLKKSPGQGGHYAPSQGPCERRI